MQFLDDLFVFTVPSLWFLLLLPVELYQRNRDEWAVSVGEFLAYGLSLSVIAAVLLAFVSTRLHEKSRIAFKATIYWVFSVGFVHTFLPFAAEERELNGILLNFDFSLWVHLISLAAMCVLGITIYSLRQKLFSHYSDNYLWVSAFILLASLVLAWVSLPSGKMAAHRTAGKLEPYQLRELYTFSRHRNLLVIILDTVPADVALEVIEAQEATASAMKDFIFFKNNLSIAPQTYMSMANLHIGSFWSESFDEHQQSSPRKVRDRSFFNLLVDAGWKLSMAARGPCPEKLDVCGATSTQNIGFGKTLSFSEQFIQAMNLVLLKTSPILLKRQVYNDEDFLIKSLDVLRMEAPSDHSGPTVQIPAFDSEAQRDNYFLTFLADHSSVDEATPRFKMFHLMSAHPRFYLDAECKKGDQQYSRDAMKNHVKCQFDAIVHLVRKLQEKGIYDVTSIFVAADHGIGFPSAFVDPRRTYDSIPHFAQVATQANALLMFKSERAGLPRMEISELPTSTVDIAMTVCDIAASDCRGEFTDSLSLLQLEKLKGDRVRVYAHHDFGAENAKLHGMNLYVVKGVLWQAENWRYVAHLPGEGGGSGELARTALGVARDAENSSPTR